MTNEIKAKVFASYIGSKIALDQSRFSEDQDDAAFILSGVVLNAFQVKETRIWYNFETMPDGKLIDMLILKPLSAITDEDAIEVAKIFGLVMAKVSERSDDKIFLKDDSYSIQITFSGYICVRKNNRLYNQFVLAAYQYLQSRGYDLPNYYLLDGKTLQECGLAIYE